MVDGEGVLSGKAARMVKLRTLNAAATGTRQGMVTLRDCVHRLIDLQMDRVYAGLRYSEKENGGN